MEQVDIKQAAAVNDRIDKMGTEGHQALRRIVKTFFKAHRDIDSLQWNQIADECFELGSVEVTFKSRPGEPIGQDYIENEVLRKDMEEVDKLLGQIDGHLQCNLGSDVRIIARRHGLAILSKF